MKKFSLILLTACFFVLTASAQTTATNFTANDCSGNSHTLFSELDAGNVVVLVWVMPCGACISPSLTTYNVVQGFSTSGCNVKYYLVDDYGNTNCSTLNSWASTNGITPTATFSNSVINMADYGGAGMPKVVVIGGATHTVFYNANNSVNSTSLQNAITAACAAASAVTHTRFPFYINVYPSPASGKATLQLSLDEPGNAKAEMFNSAGEKVLGVMEGNFAAGEHSIPIDLSRIAPGSYFINLTTEKKSISFPFLVY